MIQTQDKGDFSAFQIPAALSAKLKRLGYSVPTPIQAQVIPLALDGRDVVGIAQTGTGKTLAFAIPMIVNLRQPDMGLVLAPTRELAMQIDEVFRQLDVRTALVIGGAPMHRQAIQLRGRPSIIIATPGRLLDHMGRGSVLLQMVNTLVLDEADRMLDMGFAPAIKQITAATRKARQTMLFSATMPKEIADLASNHLSDPVRIEIATQGTPAEKIDQELYVVEKPDKPALLQSLLHGNEGTILVFTRTRHGARKLAKTVRSHGHSAAEIHSDRTLPQRIAALNGFKSGQYRVLIATDIAARGIDVKEIELVINYDIPECAHDYIHRIGRTGRAGASGRAITFASPEQHGDVRDIEKLLNSKLRVSPHSRLSLPQPVASRPKVEADGRPVAHRGATRPNRFRRRPRV